MGRAGKPQADHGMANQIKLGEGLGLPHRLVEGHAVVRGHLLAHGPQRRRGGNVGEVRHELHVRVPEQATAQVCPGRLDALPVGHEGGPAGIEQRGLCDWEVEHGVHVGLHYVLGVGEIVRPQVDPLPNVFPEAPWAMCRVPLTDLKRERAKGKFSSLRERSP